MTPLFKPLASCPLCTGELVAMGTSERSGSFNHCWQFTVALRCTNCGAEINAAVQTRSKAPAVVAFIDARERDEKRQRNIHHVSQQIVELVKADPFDALALQAARAELLELTRES